MTTNTKTITYAEGAQKIDLDEHTAEKVVESLVLRGDLSGLGPRERANHYIAVCHGLGLNPASKPLDYLKLNGKEILYPNKGATDQLAAIHKVTREIIDGPKVMDLAGTKLVYALCRATLPGGRFETSVATVPLVDPVNVLMKVETKAKRRATLSILGLGMLDEMELETIPANAQGPGGGVDLHDQWRDRGPGGQCRLCHASGRHRSRRGGAVRGAPPVRPVRRRRPARIWRSRPQA